MKGQKELILDSNEQKIFKITFILAFSILAILVGLIILNIINYKALTSYLIGVSVSVALQYFTISAIKKAKVEQYRVICRMTYIVRQLIYMVVLLVIFLSNRSLLEFIFCLGGFLTIKLAIYLFILRNKKYE